MKITNPRNFHFRAWVMNKWMDYKNEIYEMDGVIVDTEPSVYFKRYKWWLKNQYKLEMKNAKS